MIQKMTSIADVVASQFPQFVREDYTTFIAFIEAYYTFLNNQKLSRNLENIKDVNDTLDEFIQLVKLEIAPDIPTTNRFFLSNAKNFHLSRGSEESYRTLFRLLLKKEIEILYPSEKMLRVSDGRWQQDISFFISVKSGNPYDLQNDFLFIDSVSQRPARRRHKVFVKKIQQVETARNVYEIFISRNYFGKLEIGDTISYKDVVATIIPTTSKIRVVKPGNGFKVGQVFNVSTHVADGTLVKVTKVTPQGGIARLQTVAFGIGYPKDFYFDIIGTRVAQPYQIIRGNNIDKADVITDNADYGIINSNNYHSDFVDSNYVGEVLGTFYSETAEELSRILIASLHVELGAIAEYPGYYASSRSLIDDDSYIQDGEYYQDYSYVIRLDEKLSAYKDAVLSIVHPTGRKLFGEFLIDAVFNLEIEISNPLIRILLPQFSESNESFSALDKTALRVVNLKFVGDSVTQRFLVFNDFAPSEGIVIRVKVNGNDYSNWLTDGDDPRYIVLLDIPAQSAVIEIRCLQQRFSLIDNANLQSTIFDVNKSFSEIHAINDDIDTVYTGKTLFSNVESINSSGVIRINPYMLDLQPYFTENYLVEEKINF